VLSGAGLPADRAEAFQRAVESGVLLLGVHASEEDAEAIREVLASAGARELTVARWDG
jgi:hypothetical protein